MSAQLQKKLGLDPGGQYSNTDYKRLIEVW